MIETVAGVILAGGRSTRLGGGDKSLIAIDGFSLLDRVIARAAPQVAELVLSANGDPRRFDTFGLPVLADTIDGFAGPLAGILTTLEYVRRHLPGLRWVVSFAADTPLVPVDFVARLIAAVAAEDAELGCAVSRSGRHSVLGLWPVHLAGDLRHAMTAEGLRKVDLWTARYRLAEVSWPDLSVDPFLNVNTPEDLEHLREVLRNASL